MGTGAAQLQSYSKMPGDLLCLPELWAPLTVLLRPRHLRQLREGAEKGPRRRVGPAWLLAPALLWAQGGRGTDVRTFLSRVTAVARSPCSTHHTACVLTQPRQGVLRALLGTS